MQPQPAGDGWVITTLISHKHHNCAEVLASKGFAARGHAQLNRRQKILKEMPQQSQYMRMVHRGEQQYPYGSGAKIFLEGLTDVRLLGARVQLGVSDPGSWAKGASFQCCANPRWATMQIQ